MCFFYITKSISSVPLTARLKKDHASPQNFFLPPGEHFLGGARNCCSAMQAHPVRHPSIPILPLLDTSRSGASLLPCKGYSKDNVADVSSFKRVSRVYEAGRNATSRAKFLQWFTTYALRLLRIFWNFLPFSDLDSDQTSSS